MWDDMAVSEYIRELSGKSDMIKVLNICFNNYQIVSQDWTLPLPLPPQKTGKEEKEISSFPKLQHYYDQK